MDDDMRIQGLDTDKRKRFRENGDWKADFEDSSEETKTSQAFDVHNRQGRSGLSFVRSGKEGKDKLSREVEALVDEYQSKLARFNLIKFIYEFILTSFWGIVIILATVALWLNYGLCAYSRDSCSYVLLEAIVIVVTLAVLLGSHIGVVYRLRHERFIRMRRLCKALRSSPVVEEKHWQSLLLQNPKMNYLVYTRRGSGWITIPQTFLVEGDLIALKAGESAPAKIKLAFPCASEYNSEAASHFFEEGETIPLGFVPPNKAELSSTEKIEYDDLERAAGKKKILFFNVLCSPVLANVRHFLEPSLNVSVSDAPKMLRKQRDKISTFLKFMVAIMVVLNFIPASFGLIYANWRNDWESLFLAQPAYLALSITPLTIPVWETLLELWVTARLLALLEQLRTAEYNVSKLSTQVDTEDREIQLNKFLAIAGKNPSLGHVWMVFLGLFVKKFRSKADTNDPFLDLKSSKMSYLFDNPLTNYNVVEYLARTTALPCLDEDVIIQQDPVAEMVYLLDGERHAVVLDLCANTSSYDGFSLSFEDPNWNKHFATLKPLALTCLLAQAEPSVLSKDSAQLKTKNMQNATRGIRFLDSSDSLEIRNLKRYFDARSIPRQLLMVGKAIGFTEESIRQYLPISMVRIIDEPIPGLLSPRFKVSTSSHQGMIQMNCVVTEQISTTRASRNKNSVMSPRDFSSDQTKSEGSKQREKTETTDTNIAAASRPVTHRQEGMTYKNQISSTSIFPTKRNLYLLTWGDVNMVTSCCSEYWSGDSVWPLYDADREKILDLNQAWGKEYIDSVAFAFTPIPSHDSHLFHPSDALREVCITLSENSANYGVEATNEKSRLNGAELPEKQHDDASIGDARGEIVSLKRSIPNQVFTGILGCREQPYPSVPVLIEDLENAGIRFIYFSERNHTISRIVADKLGMVTDWNTSISLEELPVNQSQEKLSEKQESLSGLDDSPADFPEDPLRLHWDEKAHLPHGIEAIRRHIEEVDDVPLRVSIFTNCNPERTNNMIRILKEHGEIVAVVGNPLHHGNSTGFQESHISIAVQTPIQTFDSNVSRQLSGKRFGSISRTKIEKDLKTKKTALQDCLPALIQLELCSAFNALSTSLTLTPEISLSVLGDLIFEARNLHSNYRQVITHFLSGHLIMGGITFLNCLFGAPTWIRYFPIAWFTWIQLPILSIPFISSRETVPRKELSNKNNTMYENFVRETTIRFFAFSLIRLLPTCAVTLACFFWYLTAQCAEDSGLVWDIFFWRAPVMQNYTCVTHEVLPAQLFILFVLCWFLAIHATTLIVPNSLMHKQHFLIWISTTILSLLLQLGFNEIVLSFTTRVNFAWLSDVPVFMWILISLWPIAIVVLAKVCMLSDAKFYQDNQGKLRIIYDTRLGQYSPR